jgi:SprT-like family protein
MAWRGVDVDAAPPWPLIGEGHAQYPYIDGGKRRVSHSDGSDDFQASFEHERTHLRKRPRTSRVELGSETVHVFPPAPPFDAVEPPPSSASPPSFLVLRESRSPAPAPDPSSCSMERTESGLSISSDSSIYTTLAQEDGELLDDDQAARLVRDHLESYRRRPNRSRRERILRNLIQPRSRNSEFCIDNDALESIFSAANEIFFYGRLSQRVTWDWSHSSSAQYKNQIIGTTALRRSRLHGFETLIVLSYPILNDKKYHRSLLISTFLHELIHSYLFITCGFKARHCGGHTPGFRKIAELIDQWAGSDTLHLQNMEADLDDFKQPEDDAVSDVAESLSGCSSGPPSSLPDGYDHVVPHQHHQHQHHHYPAQQRLGSPYDDRWNFYVADRQENIGRDYHEPSVTPEYFGPHDTHDGAAARPVQWAAYLTPAAAYGRYPSQSRAYHPAPGPQAAWAHHHERRLSPSPNRSLRRPGSPYVD